MRRCFMIGLLVGTVGPIGTGSLVGTAQAFPIAGMEPDHRPEGAPVLRDVERDAAWRQRALRGIEAPVPGGLGFLDDQGAWYTPFAAPNMTGRYDIRGLHGEKGQAAM